MAHELDQTTGQAAVMVAGQPAWHKLGVNVAAAQTSADAIRLAKLDWTVEQWPLTARKEGFEAVPVTDRRANIRSDTNAVLGVVSTGYRVFQNRECFNFLDGIVADRLAMYETAGAIRGGRIVWMMARLPKTLRAVPGDEISPFILVCNSHDGSRALRLIPTSIRTVCSNTLHLALGQAGPAEGLTIYHQESLERRVKEAREKLGIITERVDIFGEQIQTLARKQMNQEQLTTYFTTLVKDRSEKQQKQLLEAFSENFERDTNTLPGMRGSFWAAFNSVSEWADHGATVRGKNDAQRADARLFSNWFGVSASVKQDAFSLALSMAS
jgi:phage/plasmid-like protein (TIGR03299 family)